jgi:hypothetical protein
MASEDLDEDQIIMESIVKKMRLRGFLLSIPKASPKEKFVGCPSVKLSISGGFSEKETLAFANALIATLGEL